jgi:hypothetical protein
MERTLDPGRRIGLTRAATERRKRRRQNGSRDAGCIPQKGRWLRFSEEQIQRILENEKNRT